jgi:hypothetical protein
VNIAANRRYQKSMDRAQAAFDAQLPDDDGDGELTPDEIAYLEELRVEAIIDSRDGYDGILGEG